MTTEERRAYNREAQRRFRERHPGYYKKYYEQNREKYIRSSIDWGRRHKFHKQAMEDASRKRRAEYLRPAQAWIAQARHEAGITQRELAERCGVSLCVVKAWERGITKARDELIKEVLGIA